MPSIVLKKIQTPDPVLNRIQDSVRQALRGARSQIGEGVLLRAVPLKAGQDNAVSHGLGRAPSSWLVGGFTTDARVWQKSPADVKILVLQCSANATVDLWVF